jgi:hypothetical protein
MLILHGCAVCTKEQKQRNRHGILMIFNPWNKPKIIGFWKAFKDYKFGKDGPLKAVEAELYDSL